MMDDIHAPTELLTQVKGIPMEKRQKQSLALKYATAACAALLGTFVVTNGVCYAATGETWVEKATVWVNNEPVELDVQMSQNGEITTGVIEYTIEDVDGEGGDLDLTMTVEGGDIDDCMFTIHDYTTEANAEYQDDCAVLEAADGSVLFVAEGSEPIDITSELKESGMATGTFTKDGQNFSYNVSGSAGNYHADVEEQAN